MTAGMCDVGLLTQKPYFWSACRREVLPDARELRPRYRLAQRRQRRRRHRRGQAPHVLLGVQQRVELALEDRHVQQVVPASMAEHRFALPALDLPAALANVRAM